MEPLCHFLGIALMVEFQQTVQDLALRSGSDSVASLPPYFVEAVIQTTDPLDSVLRVVTCSPSTFRTGVAVLM
jgi:hypothetical protein